MNKIIMTVSLSRFTIFAIILISSSNSCFAKIIEAGPEAKGDLDVNAKIATSENEDKNELSDSYIFRIYLDDPSSNNGKSNKLTRNIIDDHHKPNERENFVNSALNLWDWTNPFNWRSNSLLLRKKRSNFFDSSNPNGIHDYRLYDWGPNPTIWGSARQVKQHRNKISVPKSNEYFNPTYIRYGWHSNPNFWGKRGSWTADDKGGEGRTNIQDNPVTNDNEKKDTNAYYVPLLNSLPKSFPVSESQALEGNNYDTHTEHPSQKRSNPMTYKYADTYWTTKGRRSPQSNIPLKVYENNILIPRSIFNNELDLLKENEYWATDQKHSMFPQELLLRQSPSPQQVSFNNGPRRRNHVDGDTNKFLDKLEAFDPEIIENYLQEIY